MHPELRVLKGQEEHQVPEELQVHQVPEELRVHQLLLVLKSFEQDY